MTCKEKLIADHPDWTEERIVNYIKGGCPSDCGYLEDPTDEDGEQICYKHCSECWDREIPETEESTEVKKEKETMCACLEFLACKNRVAELEAQLKRFNQTNEDLANKLAAERAKNMKLQDMVILRDEEIDKLVKENEKLRITIVEREEDVAILTKRDEAAHEAIIKKNEEIDKLVKENERLLGLVEVSRKRNDSLEANWRVCSDENKILRVEKATQAESIKDLLKSNDKMKEDIESKDKRIKELCARIDKLDKARYIEQDIEATKKIYELFRQARPIAILKEEPTIRPFNELPYVRYARHIRMKYKALVDNGFSHDDAMALIPMWDDKELNGFKLKGDTNT